ncbi:MAG: Transferase [bacterium]|nr:Transferase [bacterium]
MSPMSSNRVLPLSPIDHVFVGRGSYPIEFLLHYPAGVDVDKMRPALQRALEVHWPLTCTLAATDEPRYVLVPAAQPIEIRQVHAAGRFDLADRDAHAAFIDGVESREGQALCRIRVTHCDNGAVLGVSISHALTDGFSYFAFLLNWALATKGLELTPISHARSALDVLGDGAAIDAKEELERRIGWSWAGARPELMLADVKGAIVRYSKEEVAALEAQARQSAVKLSVHDLLCADLWQKMVEHHYQSEEEVSFSTPIDFRRLLPRAPRNYMGNAVMLAHTRLPRRDLPHLTTNELALRLRKSVQVASVERCEETLALLDALRTRHGLGALEEVSVNHPERGFLVTNLSRLPVLQLDFGSGAPASVLPLSRAPGTASVLPAAAGSLEIHVTLPRRARALGMTSISRPTGARAA